MSCLFDRLAMTCCFTDCAVATDVSSGVARLGERRGRRGTLRSDLLCCGCGCGCSSMPCQPPFSSAGEPARPSPWPRPSPCCAGRGFGATLAPCCLLAERPAPALAASPIIISRSQLRCCSVGVVRCGSGLFLERCGD